MSVVERTTRVALRTTTGSQTVTIPGLGGLTPVAARVSIVRASADGTPSDGLSFSLGGTDGTNQWCVFGSSEHNATDSNTWRTGLTTALANLTDDTGGQEYEVDFSSFSANAINLSVTVTGTPAAYLMTVTLYAGSNLTASAGVVAVNATQDGTFTITPGFQANGGFFTWNRGEFDDPPLNNFEFSYGFMSYNGATISQSAALWRIDNNDAEVDVRMAVRDNRCAGSRNAETFEVTAVSPTQVTFTTRDAGSSASRDIGYVVFNTDRENSEVDFKAGVFDTPTSTGQTVHTDPGFKPQSVSVAGTQMEAVNTDVKSALAGTFVVSAFDASAGYSNALSEEYQATEMNNQSLSEDRALVVPLDDGSTGIAADLVTFTSSGFTLNYTDVTANAKKCPFLALQAPPNGKDRFFAVL